MNVYFCGLKYTYFQAAVHLEHFHKVNIFIYQFSTSRKLAVPANIFLHFQRKWIIFAARYLTLLMEKWSVFSYYVLHVSLNMKLDEQVSYIFDVADITDLSIAGQLIEMILVIYNWVAETRMKAVFNSETTNPIFSIYWDGSRWKKNLRVFLYSWGFCLFIEAAVTKAIFENIPLRSSVCLSFT